MNKLEEIIEALKFFNENYPKFSIAAEHDVIMMGPCKKADVSEDHQKILDDMGFFYSEEYDSYITFV